jgi:hypothetical protein
MNFVQKRYTAKAYVQSLEQRLQKMEGLLHEVRTYLHLILLHCLIPLR